MGSENCKIEPNYVLKVILQVNFINLGPKRPQNLDFHLKLVLFDIQRGV